MQYTEPEDARGLGGLRLALSRGVPAPWSEAAKSVCKLKNVPFTAVAQRGGEDNEALRAWTGHRNAPVAMYENEAPRVRWLEIVELAERIGSGPRLLPERLDERMVVVPVGEPFGTAGVSAIAGRGERLALLIALAAQAIGFLGYLAATFHGVGRLRRRHDQTSFSSTLTTWAGATSPAWDRNSTRRRMSTLSPPADSLRHPPEAN